MAGTCSRAFVLAWEPKSNIGAQLVNAHGALAWNELATPDMDASAKFYSELFGWKVEPFEGSEMPYMTIQNSDGHGNGGIRPKMEQEPVPYWLVYFGADDIDATFGKIKELGGNQLAEPMEIGEMGKIAVAQDPHGAVFALYSGQLED